MRRLILIGVLLLSGVTCYAQETEVHTLFIGEFENRADVENPLLSYLNDTLSFLFSRKDDGVKLDCMVLYREGESR